MRFCISTKVLSHQQGYKNLIFNYLTLVEIFYN